MTEGLESVRDSLAMYVVINNGSGKRISNSRSASADLSHGMMPEVGVSDGYTSFKPMSIKVVPAYGVGR